MLIRQAQFGDAKVIDLIRRAHQLAEWVITHGHEAVLTRMALFSLRSAKIEDRKQSRNMETHAAEGCVRFL